MHLAISLALTVSMEVVSTTCMGDPAVYVLSTDRTYTAGSPVQVVETTSMDTVKASEMAKCMFGLGYKENGR